MQESSVFFSFYHQECLRSVEVLPGGHGAGEPVQAKCVWQLQKPSVGAGQDSSAVQGATTQKGARARWLLTVSHKQCLGPCDRLQNFPSVIQCDLRSNLPILHFPPSAFPPQTIDQLSGIQAELQESVKELVKAKKKYYDCEQVAHAVREKADIEAK